MNRNDESGGSLLAISDLHVAYADNRELVQGLYPRSPQDWLIVAGNVGEVFADVEWVLELLSRRFAQVVWAPGDHELWTTGGDPVGLRGEARYQALVDMCRRLGVLTPEDPYPTWTGPDGPVRVAPLFLLYDDGIRTAGAGTGTGTDADETLLYPDPYPSREAWCSARVEHTERRLAACYPDLPTVLVNHFPLVRDPAESARQPESVPWCGTGRTADWHLRFRAAAVVYGHLHTPGTTWHDGVRFEEVSVGYPREWRRRGTGPGEPRTVLPFPGGR